VWEKGRAEDSNTLRVDAFEYAEPKVAGRLQIFSNDAGLKWRKRVGVEREKILITKEILWNQSGFPTKTLTSAGG
jgi:hypothetical protein